MSSGWWTPRSDRTTADRPMVAATVRRDAVYAAEQIAARPTSTNGPRHAKPDEDTPKHRGPGRDGAHRRISELIRSNAREPSGRPWQLADASIRPSRRSGRAGRAGCARQLQAAGRAGAPGRGRGRAPGGAVALRAHDYRQPVPSHCLAVRPPASSGRATRDGTPSSAFPAALMAEAQVVASDQLTARGTQPDALSKSPNDKGHDMTTPNLNWTRVAAALAVASPCSPFFAPDGAIYGPDGSTLVPPADETIHRNTNGSQRELGNGRNRTRPPWGRSSWPKRSRSPVHRPRPA